MREAQQLAMVWSLTAALPLMMMALIIQDPHGVAARVMTWVPFTSAAIVMLRASLDPAALAWWEIAGSFVVLLVSHLAGDRPRRPAVPPRPAQLRLAPDVPPDPQPGAPWRVKGWVIRCSRDCRRFFSLCSRRRCRFTRSRPSAWWIWSRAVGDRPRGPGNRSPRKAEQGGGLRWRLVHVGRAFRHAPRCAGAFRRRLDRRADPGRPPRAPRCLHQHRAARRARRGLPAHRGRHPRLREDIGTDPDRGNRVDCYGLGRALAGPGAVYQRAQRREALSRNPPAPADFLARERKAAGIGIDTPSVDYGPSSTFETHRTTMPQNVFHIENAANLTTLPTRGFTVVVAPVKIAGGSGAPTRVFARLPAK